MRSLEHFQSSETDKLIFLNFAVRQNTQAAP
jgi:hypothetical protein